MVGYETQRETLEALGAKVVAASVDGPDDAREVAEDVGFPVGANVTRDMANSIGAWWDEDGGFMQPSEFILDAEGRVRTSTYSSGPIGRIEPEAAVEMISFWESRT